MSYLPPLIPSFIMFACIILLSFFVIQGKTINWNVVCGFIIGILISGCFYYITREKEVKEK